MEPRQPPLDRRQLGAGDPLRAVRLAGDHDQHGPRAGALPGRHVLAQGQDRQRRLVEGGLEGLGAQLGAEPLPRPPGLVAGVAEVPGDRDGTPRGPPRPPPGRPSRRPGSSGPRWASSTAWRSGSDSSRSRNDRGDAARLPADDGALASPWAARSSRPASRSLRFILNGLQAGSPPCVAAVPGFASNSVRGGPDERSTSSGSR